MSCLSVFLGMGIETTSLVSLKVLQAVMMWREKTEAMLPARPRETVLASCWSELPDCTSIETRMQE